MADALDIHQAVKLSKVVEVLGTPSSVDDLRLCMDICEACRELYHREWLRVHQYNKEHGGDA